MSSSPRTDVTERFNALELTNYYALEIAHRDGELLTLRLMDYSGTDRSPDDTYNRDYELSFNMVLGGSIVADGRGLGPIDQWKAYRNSPLLDETVHKGIAYGQEFTHFELKGHSGTLSVIARDFSFAIVRMSQVLRDYTPPTGRGA